MKRAMFNRAVEMLDQFYKKGRTRSASFNRIMKRYRFS